MLVALILLILFFSFVLIKSADMVIVAIRRLSRRTNTRAFTLSAIILATASCLPEMFVGITSAFGGNAEISLGNVTGSNIAHVSVVAGVAALIAGKVRVHGNILKRDVWITMVAGLLPMILLIDGKLSRVDGLILLSVYGAYATSFFRSRYRQIVQEQSQEGFFYIFFRKFSNITSIKRKELGKLFVGIAIMIFSADVIVRLATFFAETLNLPKFLVGLIVISIGTSLPETAFSIRTLGEREPSMFFGNLLGSTIANSTLVLGLVSLIGPFRITASGKYFSASISFVVIYVVFWYFIRSKHRLDRWEALVLLILYLTFVSTEIFL